jgi:hypothetical protein
VSEERLRFTAAAMSCGPWSAEKLVACLSSAPLHTQWNDLNPRVTRAFRPPTPLQFLIDRPPRRFTTRASPLHLQYACLPVFVARLACHPSRQGDRQVTVGIEKPAQARSACSGSARSDQTYQSSFRRRTSCDSKIWTVCFMKILRCFLTPSDVRAMPLRAPT